jgi:hypothetical protein
VIDEEIADVEVVGEEQNVREKRGDDGREEENAPPISQPLLPVIFGNDDGAL